MSPPETRRLVTMMVMMEEVMESTMVKDMMTMEDMMTI